MKTTKATRRSVSVFHQLVQWIPHGLIEQTARDEKIVARNLSYTAQMLSLMLGHFLHAFSLNEICDIAQVHHAALSRTRGMTAPRRNTLSNANRTRDPAVAERVYWQLAEHLGRVSPGFSNGKNHGKLARFKGRKIYAIDSTTLKLTLNSIDWAKHRTRKAAAKAHMRTDIACMLPRFVTVGSAKRHDSTEAEALCAGLEAGDVVLADRGYNDFAFLWRRTENGVFFVVRDKQGMRFNVVDRHPPGTLPDGIISDETIKLDGVTTREAYPLPLRRVRAMVEVDGRMREMSFLTNNLKWSASTVAELYKARWTVELLFKELKQTLQLQDFFGENEKAVSWQVWTALIVHLLLRFLKHLSKWKSSYSRFAGVIRAAVWVKADLMELLTLYGTAPPDLRNEKTAEPPYLPGFDKWFAKAMGQQA